MVMTKCSECGGDVSSEAKSCPKCGYDNRGWWERRNPISQVITLLIILFFFLFLLGLLDIAWRQLPPP